MAGCPVQCLFNNKIKAFLLPCPAAWGLFVCMLWADKSYLLSHSTSHLCFQGAGSNYMQGPPGTPFFISSLSFFSTLFFEKVAFLFFVFYKPLICVFFFIFRGLKASCQHYVKSCAQSCLFSVYCVAALLLREWSYDVLCSPQFSFPPI